MNSKINLEIPDEINGLPIEMGIGISGIDAVVGPVVFVAAFAKVGYQWNTVSCNDQINPDQRVLELNNIKSLPIGFGFISYSAAEISASLYNSNDINSLTQSAIKSLAKAISAKGLFINTLQMVMSDGDMEKFRENLQKEFQFMRVVCVKKESSRLNSIRVASFYADIIRNQELSNFEFAEPETSIDRCYGSGYSDDSETIDWLNRNFDPIFGFPSIVRFHSKPAQEALKQNQVKVTFRNDENVKTQNIIDSAFFSQRKAQSPALQ
ncbi:Ribonuclease H2 subunit A [Histomonas meleagridis]|uniref:Ribonuclease H2 subunit A n=1 Tax=Histomonas meleagridis TaxID=135588 RepID=UPI003559948E|nr:Ribonuclease H2 subunit A [Histomonas meleagridis]KAH0797095.1 Ribonuclease H2 subunit A [Histomonas meleagridis]